MEARSGQVAGLLTRPGISSRAVRAVLIAAFLAGLLVLLAASPASADDDDGGEFVPRQVVAKIKPAARIGAINRTYNTATISRLPGGEKVFLLRTPRGTNPAKLANRMSTDGRILYAEPNFTAGFPEGSRRHFARPGGSPTPTSDEQKYQNQYAVKALNLSGAHSITGGAGSVVAVIDTGVQTNHPALSGKTTAGYDFVAGDRNPTDAGNGKDDDRDGYVDEMVGHGTHVAGIALLASPRAKIMPVRALDSDGRGTTFGVARAIEYAVRKDADVVNLSLGSSAESDLLEDLIGDDDDDDDGRGTVFVASVGNDNNAIPQYPAAEDGVIAVTSVDQQEEKSDFANYGRWVGIAAPGTGIHSPFPVNRYAKWSGTSMATPFVAGQAALVRSLRPSATGACVADVIGRTARSLNSGFALGAGHADIGASTQYVLSNSCSVGDDD